MKDFKKSGFWVLFAFIVLIGSLIILNFSFQEQSPGIHNVNAQSGQPISNFPGDTIYTPRGSFKYYETAFGGHPGGTIYTPRNPKFPDNSDDDYYMPGVLTMPTASTCGWDCSPTFTNCPPNPGTSLTCSSGIFCGGPSPTSSTCGIFCDGGPMPTSSTCGIFCDGGPMPTSSTCSGGIFCDGWPMPTSSTCGSMFCGGNTVTLQTCIGNCPTDLPIALPVDFAPWWRGSGSRVPQSIVPFPAFSATPSY